MSKNKIHPVLVRVDEGDVQAIDAYIHENGAPYISRAEACRRLVRFGLRSGKSSRIYKNSLEYKNIMKSFDAAKQLIAWGVEYNYIKNYNDDEL